MKRILVTAAGAIAAVVLSACGSARPVASATAHTHSRSAGSLTFVAASPSPGLGVDNTDLYSATPSGRIRAVTSTAAAETNAVWSDDGRHVIFGRQWISGKASDSPVHEGIFVWSPGHGGPRQVRTCSFACFDQNFVWSPDDSKIAFDTTQGDTGIKVMNADGSGVRTLCAPTKCGPGLAEAAWSPDGRKLAFSNALVFASGAPSTSAIWVANADGSGAHQVTQPGCDPAQGPTKGCAIDTTPAWSPDGSAIAFSRQGTAIDLEVVSPDGSHLRILATCHPTKDDCSVDPAWSPSGHEIAWAGRDQIELTTLTGRTSTVRTCAGSRCVDPFKPRWSPNGEELSFFTGNEYEGATIWTIGRNGSGLRLITRGAQCCVAWIDRAALPGQAPRQTNRNQEPPNLSGTIAFDNYLSTKPHRALGLLSLDTGRVSNIRVETSDGIAPSWSPDGREIVFGGTPEWADTANLYVVNREGSRLTELLHYKLGPMAPGSEPAWSPDGRDIAFVSRRGIELIQPGNAAHTRLLFRNPGQFKGASEPAWAPTGNKLVFSRRLGGILGDALYTIRADGTGMTRLTNLTGSQDAPAWSPNGREIAFNWWTSAGDSIYLIRPDGTHLRRVTTQALPEGRPAWSPDGRYLVLLPETSRRTAVDIVDVKTGRVTQLRTKIDGVAANPSWSSR